MFWQRVRVLQELRRRAPGAHVHYSCEIEGVDHVELAPGVQIGRACRLIASSAGGLRLHAGAWLGDGCELGGATGVVVIGERTSVQVRSHLLGDVELGAGCVCAPNLYISSHLHQFSLRPELPIRVQDQLSAGAGGGSRPVTIGDDCWLGINVVVAPGVRIGRGCVVGANSVVTRDLPPYVVAAGAPARILRRRLDFAPPPALDANDDAHLPYFYAGVRQLNLDGERDTAVPRRRGGLEVRERFALALAAAGGAAIELSLDPSSPITIRHGGVSEPVSVAGSVRFVAAPDPEGLLWFSWTAQASSSLVLRGARVAAAGEPAR